MELSRYMEISLSPGRLLAYKLVSVDLLDFLVCTFFMCSLPTKYNEF